MGKYENPDKRCTYPYSDSPLGYCWGYTGQVDEGKTPEEIAEYCKKGIRDLPCAYFRE